jgi:hypothetical protein
VYNYLITLNDEALDTEGGELDVVMGVMKRQHVRCFVVELFANTDTFFVRNYAQYTAINTTRTAIPQMRVIMTRRRTFI